VQQELILQLRLRVQRKRVFFQRVLLVVIALVFDLVSLHLLLPKVLIDSIRVLRVLVITFLVLLVQFVVVLDFIEDATEVSAASNGPQQ